MERTTYEIMKAEDVGWEGESMPLVKHSGKHALRVRLEFLGYRFDEELVEMVYKEFTNLADNKTYVYNDDLFLLVQEVLEKREAMAKHLIMVRRVDYHRVEDKLLATVALVQNGIEFEASGSGDGPVASIWNAVVKALSRQGILKAKLELKDFNVGKASGGVEAVGLVTLRVESEQQIGYGRGSDTDIVFAFAKALVAAINHLLQVPVKVRNE